jgi:hypothetical protein
MEAAATRRIDVGRVISETFSTYGANAGPLLGSAFIIFLISGLLQGLLNDEGGLILTLLATVVSLIAQALYTGFVVRLVEDVRDGRRDMTAGQMMADARPAILPLIVNGILRGIAIAIGLLLLIVPGLYLMTIWAVTSPAIVSESEDSLGAFGRSQELVKGNGWPVFGVIVIAFLITVAISIVAAAVGAAIGLAGLIILAIIAAIVTAPISALVSAIMFFDLGGGSGAAAPPAPIDPPPPPAATA